MAPALLYVTSSPETDISEERYHEWYDNQHIPAQLTIPGVSSAVRFKCVNSKRWLALYDLDSPEVVDSDEYKAVAAGVSANERELIPKLNADLRLYDQVSSIG